MINGIKKILTSSLLVLSFLVTNSYAALPVAVEGQPLPSLAPMLKRVQGAVVNVVTESEVVVRRQSNPLLDDPFFSRFFDQGSAQPRSKKRQGMGSGVIFNANEGLILTNAHVIEDADKVTVTLKDGREASAQLVGVDKDSDVAVIQIQLDGLTQIPLGDSDILEVGDFVVAIGNPFGLSQTVTSGIISALGRSGLGIENYEDFIQTDASINIGNSGGALVNLRGELVGINTAIVAPAGGNVGIGFSIPINMALQVKDQLVQHGEVQRGQLGVRVQNLTPDLAEAFDYKQTQGAIVTRVEADSMAYKAGVKPGDIIIKANDKEVIKSADLRNTIGLLRVGDRLTLEVVRGEKRSLITTTIGDVEVDGSIGENLNARLQGATFSELNDNQQIGGGLASGVLVSDVKEDSTAWYHGLRPDDIIVSANRKTIPNIDSFRMAVTRQDVLLLNVVRANNALFLLLQ